MPVVHHVMARAAALGRSPPHGPSASAVEIASSGPNGSLFIASDPALLAPFRRRHGQAAYIALVYTQNGMPFVPTTCQLISPIEACRESSSSQIMRMGVRIDWDGFYDA